MRLRVLAIGATTIVATGLVLSAAAPAYAQDAQADVQISLTGTTIADGVAGKFGKLTLSNNGPDAASGIEFTYDLTNLDTSKVDLVLEDCVPDGGIAVCIIDPDGLANGEHVNFIDFLQVVPGATGDAGSITMSITHDGTDPDPANNTVTAPVTIGGTGPDLLVIAPDVHNEADVENFEVLDTPVVPGSDALVEIFVANQGAEDAVGIEISLSLPEHVTFTLPEPECTHAVGDSTTTCSYASVTLTAGYGPDTETCNNNEPCAFFVFPVRVSEDAPSPASLTGGVAAAWAMEAMLFSAPAAELPRNLTAGPAPDVDPSDNTSTFTVFVSEVDDEPGGGGGGLGDDDGPLPVTGAPALLIGGTGAAVLAAGAVLFLVARRRRVVLAAPDSDG